jgi:cytochrome c553/mono/diheme cytochrome c family protein
MSSVPLLRTIALVALLAVSARCHAAANPGDAEKLAFFERRIRPLLAEHCYECHSSEAKKIKGALALDTRDALMRGGESGPVIVPGEPDKSRLIEAVRWKNRDLQMPPKKSLSPEQIRDLEQWVKLGAPDPRTTLAKSAGRREINIEEGRKFWSFQPFSNPAVPTIAAANTIVRSPIDAFLLEPLARHGVAFAPPADKRTLIRRATFDLIGLPPTPAEIAAFLADDSPEAFSRVVERLLNSPRYGERWGRHWLDVARYADSNGLDENVAHGNAWRYRDYVIAAFNKDKPYDQFVIEQIAGDLLASKSPEQKNERLTALGFLCIGPKLLAEPDKVKLEMDLIDEQIDTLGRAFMGMTLGCARCHEHKFDPIPTEDYYALAAILKSTRTMDDLKTIAKWHEPVVATPAELEAKAAYDARIATRKTAISNFVAEANKVLLAEKKLTALPKNPESQYPTNTVAALIKMRDTLATEEKGAPEIASTMGVTDSTNIVKALAVHIRGSHLKLGAAIPRGVPQVMTVANRRVEFPERSSGRLEFARWLASAEHPLTARVMVNRIWRWHFGAGLVASTDNFGSLGERASHPELLDWLARRFTAEGWSVKAMHRLIMNSAAYQQSSRITSEADSERLQRIEPDNRLLARFPVRRLEAEEIRDALMFVSGRLDAAMGGKTIPLKNREFVFNHTSKDATTYESTRRAVYLPIIRNHLYDLFEQFDFPDPAVATGSRNATVVAPQALLMMNSDLVAHCAKALAEALIARSELTDDERFAAACERALGRRPGAREVLRAKEFLRGFTRGNSEGGDSAHTTAWAALCQALLAGNEFIFLN